MSARRLVFILLRRIPRRLLREMKARRTLRSLAAFAEAPACRSRAAGRSAAHRSRAVAKAALARRRLGGGWGEGGSRLRRISQDTPQLAAGSFIPTGMIGFLALLVAWFIGPTVGHAACGSVSCFIVIGSQQQIPQKGLLTVNGIYNYTPIRTLLDGTTGIIPEVSQATRRLIPNHHREVSTIVQTYTLDLNYGVTDRFGLAVTVPYSIKNHDHFHFHMGADAELIQFRDKGIGDVRLTAKYNALPTLRSMLVAGLGIELPTGDTEAKDSFGGVMEAPLQIGRGNVGLVGTLYQTYELLPHRLNQFAFLSYRHTFRNNDGYQFGDEYLINAGLNLVTLPWLVLTNQVNYRYNVHDNFSASIGSQPIEDRRVPNTGSTYLAYSPGVQIAVGERTSFYFFAQIPLVRDFNNNLAQGVSYVGGITQRFHLLGS